MRRAPPPGLALALVLGLGLAPPGPARADDDLDTLLAGARALSPEVQIATLEAEAALARVEGAGALADPKVSVSVEDWPRSATGGFTPSNPAAGTTKKLRVSQDLPFWGKRDLKREIAEANARKAGLLRRQVENDLIARIKVAYAELHAAHAVADLARDLRRRLDTLSRMARARYAQAQGRQQDVTRAAVETAALDAEIIRTEAERHKARVRLNRLLARPLDTPLGEGAVAPALRLAEPPDLDSLTERARRDNPEIAAEQAAIDGADTARALAEKGWYPDVEIGVGAVKRDGDWRGYEAMVSLSVPLQWTARESEIGEATAMAGAARARRDQRALELSNAVADSWIGLRAAREVETLLRDQQIPQADAGFQAAARSYELGRSEMLDVLIAEQQVWKSGIELVKARFEQQMRLAELEKLVGGAL